jgi:hypothetical protein
MYAYGVMVVVTTTAKLQNVSEVGRGSKKY